MVNTQVKRVKKQKFIAGTALLLGMATFGMVGKADDLSSSNTNGGVDNSKVDNDNQESVKTSTEGVSSTTENANTVPGSKVTSTVDSESAPSKTISVGTQSNISGTSDGSDSLQKTETSDSSSKPSTSDSSSKPSTSDSSSKPSTSNSSSKPSTSNSSSNNNSATKPSTTTQAPPVAPSTTAPSATPSTTAPSNYYQNSSYNQTSTAAQIPNSSSDSAASVYSGPVLKKIEAAKSIEKIDSSSTEAFIKSIADRVRILAGKNNLYASIILAQAILESGSGQSNMTQQYFNIFNITGAYLGKSISFKTEEFSGNNPYYIEQSYIEQSFRVYSNYDQALDDYINLMIKGTTWNSEIYAGAWKSHAKTYQEAAQALQGIFATDPEYAQKLIEIIEEYNLNFYDNLDSTTQVLDSNIPESPLVASKLDSSTYPDYNGVDYPGADSYAFGNCTQYVYNRIIQLGGQIGTHMGNGGEWGINAQAQGYFTTTVPTEGYAVSFPPGVAGSSPEYGHVAFVEKVYPDNSILVSEMNVKGNNIVSERHISAGVAALATYIQPK